jgi:hypothetical protein
MEDNLKKIKMEDDQSTKINLIGCDTIVNLPSNPLKPRKKNANFQTADKYPFNS